MTEKLVDARGNSIMVNSTSRNFAIQRGRERECKEEKNNQEGRSSFTADCHEWGTVGNRFYGLG